MWLMPWLLAAISFVVAWILIDIGQRKHAIIHNFPILGHFRYWLEAIGPELRQYIVTSNNEELPFSRDQRSWIYASSKQQNNYSGFGTDQSLELSSNHLIIKHAAFPLSGPKPGDVDFDPRFPIPCAKVLGQHRGRAKAFRPTSIVNISAMSYGSLSGPAVEAINRGLKELPIIAKRRTVTGKKPFHRAGLNSFERINERREIRTVVGINAPHTSVAKNVIPGKQQIPQSKR